MRGERGAARRCLGRARRVGLTIGLALALAACASEPEIVAGGPTTVTVKSGSNARPDATARDYCAQHGREAVYRGGIVPEQLGAAIMHAYDCVEPGQ